MLTPDKPTGRFISILADGKLHEGVPEGTEDAVKRDYETSDGKKGSKWEMVYTKLDAKITNVQFWDGDFGEQIQLTFSDKEGNEVTLSQNVASNFGEDILKKLPAIDFSKDLTMKPYAFTDEETGKPKRGVTFYQNGDKVMDFFYDAEEKKKLHGFPEPKSKDMSKDEWKLYFLECRIFLTKYAKERIVPKFLGDVAAKAEYPEEEIDPANIPF